MRRVAKLIGFFFIAILASYGLAWFLMADSVVETVCENRLRIVRYDAEEAESKGNWLKAAHHYAHLLEYMDDPVKGCASPRLNDKNEFLPIALWLLELRWGSLLDGPVMERDIAQERYALALANSGSDSSGATAGKDAAVGAE